MKKQFISFVAFCLSTGSLFSQIKSLSDSTHTIQEVEVIGNLQKKVSVGKLSIPLHYLPMSVSTINSQTLDARGITNIEDAVKFLPGVRMSTGYGAFQTLYVRGMTYSPIAIDGVRDERTLLNSNPIMDMTSVESIELLKGPASVLYGHSVVGGILNIVRKAPSLEKIAKAKMSYGSWNNQQANLDFGGKLTGPVNYRSNFNYSTQSGWRSTGNKRLSAYLALEMQLDATSKVDLRGSAHKDWYGTETGLPAVMTSNVYNLDGSLYLASGEQITGLNKAVRYNNQSDFLKNDAWDIFGKYEKSFGKNTKLTNLVSYRYDDINYFGTEELSYLYNSSAVYNHYILDGDTKTYICLDSVQLTYPLRFSHIANTFTDQLELNGSYFTGNVKHNFIGGYAFTELFRNTYTGYNDAPEDDKLNSTYDVYGPGLYSIVAVNNPQSMGYMDSKFSEVYITKHYSHGLFFQDLMEISPKLKVLVAGRYDFYKYLSSSAETHDGKRQYHKSEQDPYNVAKNNAFTYRLGAVYLPTPSLSLYVSASSYFRPDRTFPSSNYIYLNKNGLAIDAASGKNIFDPETGYQYEVGFKHSYLKILQTNVSAFYIRKENVIRKFGRKNIGTTDSPVYRYIVGQVGSEESRGIDAEISLAPVRYAAINIGYSYTDTRTRKIKSNDYISVDNQNITLVPRNTFYTYGNISVPQGCFKGLSYHFSVSFMDRVYTDYAKSASFDSYWLTDMGLSYALQQNVKLVANVNNVFNKEYYKDAINDIQKVPGIPRNYLLTVQYDF